MKTIFKTAFVLIATTATSAYAAMPATVTAALSTCCEVGAACCIGGACC